MQNELTVMINGEVIEFGEYLVRQIEALAEAGDTGAAWGHPRPLNPTKDQQRRLNAAFDKLFP